MAREIFLRNENASEQQQKGYHHNEHQIGEKVVNIALIPFMRSRKVFFKAQGLRPNSKLWPYFDGQLVEDWVREEPFQRFSTVEKDYGNTYNNAVAHPEGAGILTSDANGSVTGSFFIPNTKNIRFRTGTREFKILDISVNDDTKSTTNASGLYISTGYLDTIDQTFKSTRILNIEAVVSTKKIQKPSGGGGGGGDYSGGTGAVWNGGYNGQTPGDYYGESMNSNDGEGPGDQGGASGGMGTHICTAAYEMGVVGHGNYRELTKYGIHMRRTNPMLMRGYDILGPQFAKWVKKSKTGETICICV